MEMYFWSIAWKVWSDPNLWAQITREAWGLPAEPSQVTSEHDKSDVFALPRR